MHNNHYFKQQQPKLKLEAWLRSVLCGLAVSFGATFLAATILWFLPMDGWWLLLVFLAVVTAISTPIFYFARFRPDDQKNARRIDQLGLEERLITMVEFENEDSYMAQVQRKDAQAVLSSLDNKRLKIKISGVIVLALSLCVFFGAGMLAINAVSEAGLLPGGDELLSKLIEEQNTVYVMVSYVADEGGYIEGDEDQILVQGTDAVRVTAVADEGYVFKCWSDGNENPTRADKNIGEDVVYEAYFELLKDESDDGDSEGLGDEATDVPGDQSSDNGETGGETTPNEPPKDDESDAGGAAEPNNQIINGETYYREMLEMYQDSAEELLKDPESGLSEAEKELIKKYLGIV